MKQRQSIFLTSFMVLLLLTACSPGSQAPGPMNLKAAPNWTSFAVNSDVHALAFEGKTLWVGTEGGLLQYDLSADRIVNKFTNQNGLLSNYIYSITLEKDGTKWIGTLGGGLARYDGKSWELTTVPKIADMFVYDVLFDQEGNMWVATWSGLSVKRGESWQTYTTADGLIDNWVYDLDIDRQGILWAGTEGGVSRFDGKSWISYTHKDGLGASLEALGGAEKVYNPSVHHQTEEGKRADDFNPNYVLAVTVGPKKDLWFGTWGAGLSRFDGKSWRTYTTREGLAGNFVTDLHFDRKGLLWVTTESGISIFDGKSWRRLTSQDGLIDDSVYTVVSDPSGHPWFGTISGISKLEGFAIPTPPRASSAPPPSRS